MTFLCERFGNPQRAYRVIHVAGSKGKGSVAAMIRGCLGSLGFRAGLYASPHVTDFSERVNLGETLFGEDVYRAAFAELVSGMEKIQGEDLPGGRPVTWFEMATLFAFLTFRHAACDWAVCETGLGGRLDATNVVAPEAAVITVIEKEHTQYLGNTLAEIAGEKAGIIKRGAPVILGAQTPEARAVFEERAAALCAPLTYGPDSCRRSWSVGRFSPGSGPGPGPGTDVRLESPLFARPLETRLSLCGGFQAENAALAALAIKTVLPQADEGAIERGLSGARLPARFEVVEHPAPGVPALVIDGAHTVGSVRETLRTFEAVFGEVRAALLFACAEDKEAEAIARLFAEKKGRFEPVILTVPGAAKKADVPRLTAAFSGAGLPHTFDPSCGNALERCLEEAGRAGKPALVLGSFYLAGEVKKRLKSPFLLL